MRSKLDDRERQLSVTLESGPPKEYLNTMDNVLMSIKTVETTLGGDFHITEVTSLEDEIQKYKVGTEFCFSIRLYGVGAGWGGGGGDFGTKILLIRLGFLWVWRENAAPFPPDIETQT